MKNQLVLLFLLALLAGCYPDGPEYAEETDVVYTVHDEEYDFAAKSTYAMPDKIVVDVEFEAGDTIYEYMNPIYATPILQNIQRNMQEEGWQLVGLNQNPDLLLTPAGMSSTTFFYSYWYDWWYGGYWGWYYPPYYTVSSYTTGTLLMVLADPDQANESPINRSPALWIGAANGLLTGGYDVARVTEAIDQAFEQSPYLKTN